MRVTGWSKLFLDFTADKPHLHVLTEAELLEAVVSAGHALGPDWRTIIAHAMRCIGWRLRSVSRTYVRRPLAARATDGGAS